MHISRIKTINFGAAKDKEVHLSDGLIVVRAPNGAGKSSLFYQAPMYAFFGTSTLDATVEETVTDGEKPGSMLVEVDYGPYKWKRSKGSASVVGEGLQISGQAEVTAFSEQLFGVSKDNAEMVLVSKQGETAGLVAKKGAAINQFIEDAANFQQLEDIIERAKTLYPHGYVEMLEEQQQKCEIEIEETGNDIRGLEQDLEVTNTSEAISAKLLLEQTLKDSQAKLAAAESSQKLFEQYGRLTSSMDREKLELDSLEKERGGLKNKEYVYPDRVPADKYIAEWPTMQGVWSEYREFLGMKVEEPFWEGDETNFLAELELKRSEVAKVAFDLNALMAEIVAEKKRISKTTLCPTCGTDLSEKISKINAEAELRIALLNDQWEDLAGKMPSLKSELTQLEEIKKKHVYRKYEHITWDKDTVPFRAVWEGEVPSEPDQATYKEHAETIRQFDALWAQEGRDKKRIVELESMIQKSIERYQQLLLDRDALGEVHSVDNLQVLKDEVTKCSNEFKAAESKVRELEQKITEINTQIKEKKNRIVTLENDVKAYAVKIKADKENARFIKVLRDTKPRVLQKVWHSILSVIETPFKEITGKEFEIGRGAKSFTAGGRSAARLSGSEKSILGLCFRSALRDLFAPGAGFIILDEPFADSDQDRTAAGIAALMQMRGQKILVTHESQTELSADQVIEL